MTRSSPPPSCCSDSAVQLQAFAAPKNEGIWGEVREEIASGITQQGGIIDEVEGPLGWELRAQVPVQLPDGTNGVQVVRFVGVDGPRWFLRGVISGQGAVQPQAAGLLEHDLPGHRRGPRRGPDGAARPDRPEAAERRPDGAGRRPAGAAERLALRRRHGPAAARTGDHRGPLSTPAAGRRSRRPGDGRIVTVARARTPRRGCGPVPLVQVRSRCVRDAVNGQR